MVSIKGFYTVRSGKRIYIEPYERKNCWDDEEYRSHQVKVHTGYKWTKEQRKKIVKKMKEKPHSSEHNRKVSDSRKGIVFSEEHINNLSKSHKGQKPNNTPEGNKKISETMKKVWANRSEKEKEVIFGKIFKKNGFKPTGLEIKFNSFLQDNFSDEWKYVGDGQVWFGGKCPDFINYNGKKKLIEIFGRYWHKPEDEEIRKNHFKQFGFDTIVVWDYELKNLSELREKIQVFQGGTKC